MLAPENVIFKTKRLYQLFQRDESTFASSKSALNMKTFLWFMEAFASLLLQDQTNTSVFIYQQLCLITPQRKRKVFCPALKGRVGFFHCNVVEYSMWVIHLLMVFFSLEHTVTLIYFQTYHVPDCKLKPFSCLLSPPTNSPFLSRWIPFDPHHQ